MTNGLPLLIGGSVNTGKTLWVDGTNGNNSTAVSGRLDKPYLTIVAAITAASSGDEVRIGPKTSWNEAITLKNGVRLYFEPGATVDYSSSTTGPTFTDGGSAVTCVIAGFGDFKRSGTPGGGSPNPVFSVSNASSNISIYANSIANTATAQNAEAAVYVAGGTVTVRANTLSSTNYDCLLVGAPGGGTLTVYADTITGGDDGIEWGTGTLNVYARSITGGGSASSLNLLGGTVLVHAKTVPSVYVESATVNIYGASIANFQQDTGGTVSLSACQIDSSADVSIDAVTLTGGTLNLIGCTVKSNAAKKDINRSGGTANVINGRGTNADGTFTTTGTVNYVSNNISKTDIGSTVQAYDADLTTWAGITPGTGVGTFLTTPSIANLKAALTDETTVGWNLFSLANPTAVTFLRINADNTVTTRSATNFKADLNILTDDISGLAPIASTGSATDITTGILNPAFGGTGVSNNEAATLTRSGSHALTLTTTGTTSVTLPTSGTLQTTTGSPAGFIIASQATGDLLYASSATAWARLADVAAGSYLRSGGVTTAPVWSTTTLPNSATTGDLLYASASNVYSNLNDVVTGSVLISGGVATAPSWSSTPTFTATNVTGLPITGITSSTSAQLRTLLSDENGTGAALFDGATSPTFITPALGTPSALVGTNITGTATAFNINGTVGATTPAAGTFTTLTTTGSIELGNASDTTLSRVSAGVAAIEGVTVSTSSNTLTLSNKTLTAPIVAILKPVSDSTTAIQITKADGTTAVGTWDTTNSRLGINITPSFGLHIKGTGTSGVASINPLALRGSHSSLVEDVNILFEKTDGTRLWSFGSSINSGTAHEFVIYDESNSRIPLYCSPSGGVTIGGSTNAGLGSLVIIGGATFGTSLASTTALATPSALSATQFTGFASTVSGAAIMGYGTTGDVTLKNRAGTDALIVGPNTTLVTVPGTLSSGTTIRLKGYTVAGLPAGTTGDTAYVTDALAPSFLSTVVGGGSTVTPVFYNGSAWVGY